MNIKRLIHGKFSKYVISAIIGIGLATLFRKACNSRNCLVFKAPSIDKIKNQVPSAIFPELNSNLSCPALVTALASRLNIAVSIDNGVMHMMSLANIPMIVLFGPTNSKKFAPKNKFTKVLDSKIIHNTKDINSIDVDEVLSLI